MPLCCLEPEICHLLDNHGSHLEFLEQPMQPGNSKYVPFDRSLHADVSRAIIHVNTPLGSIFITFYHFGLV